MLEVAVHKHQLGGCFPASPRFPVCQSLPALRLLKNQMPKPTADKEHFYLLQKSFCVFTIWKALTSNTIHTLKLVILVSSFISLYSTSKWSQFWTVVGLKSVWGVTLMHTSTSVTQMLWHENRQSEQTVASANVGLKAAILFQCFFQTVLWWLLSADMQNLSFV